MSEEDEATKLKTKIVTLEQKIIQLEKLNDRDNNKWNKIMAYGTIASATISLINLLMILFNTKKRDKEIRMIYLILAEKNKNK